MMAASQNPDTDAVLDAADDRALLKSAALRSFVRALRRETGDGSANAQSRRFNKSTHQAYPSSTKGTATWYNFEAGRHMPSPKTLDKVSKILKRPAHSELCAPLWLALDITQDVRPMAGPLIGATIGIDALVIQRSLNILLPVPGIPGEWMSAGPDIDFNGAVRMETLGALVLLVRLGHALNKPEETRQLAIALALALPTLGIELHERGIAEDVYRLCRDRIFPLADYCPFTSFKEMATFATALNLAPWTELGIQDNALSWSSRISLMADFMNRKDEDLLAAAIEEFRAGAGNSD